MCGCGRTSMPAPAGKATGPMWSRKMNGPTVRWGKPGSTRRTTRPPMSRVWGLSRETPAFIAAAASVEAPVLPHHPGALLGRGRDREAVALDLVAAVRREQLELLLRLDALGHDLELEAVGEADDRERDHRVLRVGGDVAHERVVDLERVDREALEVGEARVPRAEVVDRDLHARVLEPAQRARRALGVAHEERLGELELHQPGVHARLAQRVPHDRLEILLLELPRGQVDGDGLDRQPLALPGADL